MLVFYVDDLIIGAENQELADKFIAKLEERFKIKRLGFPVQFTGLQVHRMSSTMLILHQQSYIQQMAQKFGTKQFSPNPMTKFTKQS